MLDGMNYSSSGVSKFFQRRLSHDTREAVVHNVLGGGES